jgi:hypothetical protein
MFYLCTFVMAVSHVAGRVRRQQRGAHCSDAQQPSGSYPPRPSSTRPRPSNVAGKVVVADNAQEIRPSAGVPAVSKTWQERYYQYEVAMLAELKASHNIMLLPYTPLHHPWGQVIVMR